MHSCDSILECCNVFRSEVEYKIVCFISCCSPGSRGDKCHLRRELMPYDFFDSF